MKVVEEIKECKVAIEMFPSLKGSIHEINIEYETIFTLTVLYRDTYRKTWLNIRSKNDDWARLIPDLKFQEFPSGSLLDLLFQDDKISGDDNESDVESDRGMENLTMTTAETKEHARVIKTMQKYKIKTYAGSCHSAME